MVTGQKTIDGHQAAILENGPNYKGGDPGTKDVVVVDAASFRLMYRTTKAPDAIFVQNVVVEKSETIALAGHGKSLKLSAHKAAKK